MPVMSGRCTSSSTRSGRSRAMSSRAAWPVLATPTTPKPAVRSTNWVWMRGDHEVVVDDEHRRGRRDPAVIARPRDSRQPRLEHGAAPSSPARRRRSRPDARRPPAPAPVRHPGPRRRAAWCTSRGGRSRRPASGGTPGPVSATAHPDRRRLEAQVDLDRRAAHRHGRVDRVVDEVAEHRADVGRELRVEPGQAAVVGRREVDAPLGGEAGLRDEERGDGRVVDARGDRRR